MALNKFLREILGLGKGDIQSPSWQKEKEVYKSKKEEN